MRAVSGQHPTSPQSQPRSQACPWAGPLPLFSSFVVTAQIAEAEVCGNDSGVSPSRLISTLRLKRAHQRHKRMAVDSRH